MTRRSDIWSLLGLVLVILALIGLPAGVMAAEASKAPCHGTSMAPHHDCGDHAMTPADCLMICAAALPAPTSQLPGERASYALRFRDADTLRTGIVVTPEDPPPR